jgi:membrane associated rhomboid family serine protease
MERAVYAVFDSCVAAQSAVHAMLRRRLPHEVLGMQLHSGTIDVDDLPPAATLARRWALLAAVLLVVVGAMMVFVADDPSGVFFGAVSGALVGTLFAASSGRRTPKPEVASLYADVERGRTIVTMDVTRAHVGLRCERFLQRHGALRVGMT